jgi:thiosulfate/3-mercaptopyruvate sulfurtransferase
MIFVLSGSAGVSQPKVLVDAAWLKDHLADPGLVVLQVNSIKLDYDAEHIEGARFLWPGWLAPDSPLGSMNVPDLKSAEETLSLLGVSNTSHIVVCHVRNEVSLGARMFVMLEYLGLKGKVSFLNGGLEAWKKQGNPTSQKEPVVKKTKFKATLDPVVVDKEYVKSHLKAPETVIVDARLPRFYNGEPTGYPRDGHIAGAGNIPYPNLIEQSTNMYKPADSLFRYFNPVAGKDKELVAYCFIGQTASVVYLGGRILGYTMKLYDGSMQEWSRIKELPMESKKP